MAAFIPAPPPGRGTTNKLLMACIFVVAVLVLRQQMAVGQHFVSRPPPAADEMEALARIVDQLKRSADESQSRATGVSLDRAPAGIAAPPARREPRRAARTESRPPPASTRRVASPPAMVEQSAREKKETRCRAWKSQYGIVIGSNWGSAPDHVSKDWRSIGCDDVNFSVLPRRSTPARSAPAQSAAPSQVAVSIGRPPTPAAIASPSALGKLTWWDKALIEGRAVLPTSPFAARMMDDWNTFFLDEKDEWPGQSRGAAKPGPLQIDEAKRHALAALTQPRDMTVASPDHCPELTNRVKNYWGVDYKKEGLHIVSSPVNWKREFLIKLGRVMKGLGQPWWVIQGTMFQVARGGALNDDDFDVGYIPRRDVEPGPFAPWGCGTDQSFCSASELSRGSFLAEIEKRMYEEFDVKGFASFKHNRGDVYMEFPHRKRAGASPGHMIVHSPYFKAEVTPAVIDTSGAGHVVQTIYAGCGRKFRRGYPCTVFPLSAVFPLGIARVSDLEVPVPNNPAAYAMIDAHGEYNGADGSKQDDGGVYQCLMHSTAGCGDPAELLQNIATMRAAEKCGYTTMLDLMKYLDPPFADGVKCYKSCFSAVFDLPAGV